MELPTPSTASEQQTVDDIDKFGWAFLGGPVAADALLRARALHPRAYPPDVLQHHRLPPARAVDDCGRRFEMEELPGDLRA